MAAVTMTVGQTPANLTKRRIKMAEHKRGGRKLTSKEKASVICCCDKCGEKECEYRGKYIRLPGELFYGAEGKCPKLADAGF